jgi:hypothetical protein
MDEESRATMVQRIRGERVASVRTRSVGYMISEISKRRNNA